MTTATATEVKNKFGQYLEQSLGEPVVIEKSGRPVAVMLSMKDYERLTEAEDTAWAERALKAERKGYLGSEVTMAAIEKKWGN